MNLTANELQFMQVLWNADQPLTSAEIREHSTERTWKDTSLHTILNRLLEKEAVKEVGYKKEGKAISRTFKSSISCEEYYASFFNEHSKKDSKTLPIIFSALLRSADIGSNTLDKLEDIIRKKKSEIK